MPRTVLLRRIPPGPAAAWMALVVGLPALVFGGAMASAAYDHLGPDSTEVERVVANWLAFPFLAAIGAGLSGATAAFLFNALAGGIRLEVE